ncbi:glutathione S-transferase N-terminal domain-containing protein [Fulvimarina sp. 2208YS6-2-32]|uniref:Glutathione S-transferase N-terminal domain-containing protein n=1 Tax=Fulvimarina uroteuthidis TaxID=3098149 RepID=A0ABU5I2Z9_9HYPH|nr:glutathione S-transferase N-terminal domain-containing protein [Fulvimarina sp. 2208YS6-2-32]MDY8109740.1 glutathione S-transferase N-terminal domain-containing protein [Fulvimarina sp. 2208YS6-2-32]
MRLLGTSASPFVAKVRMAAVLCGIELEFVSAETMEPSDTLLSANPLGKVPVLTTETGDQVFDSSVICEMLDRMSGNQLIPQTLDAFTRTRTFEAAASGVKDALILCLYEERFRPEDKRHAAWTERQMAKAERGLAWLEAHLDDLNEDPSVAYCALAALVGWMDLRFAGKVASQAPKVRAWTDAFFAAHPELAAVKPHLA